MMRLFFIILAFGMLTAMLGRVHPNNSFKMPEAAQRSFDNHADRIAELKARNAPQFSSQDGSLELQRESDGHFYADVRINGAPVHMLIDTGASTIALSREDAQSAGIATSIGMNDVIGEGADGAVHGEYVRLETVELGPLKADGLEAVVLNSGQESLLGQNFLSQFASVQIEGDRMILR